MIGGGLAGLASAAALGQCRIPGGPVRSPWIPGRPRHFLSRSGRQLRRSSTTASIVLLRCCVNLMDFYGRLGVADRIQFHKQFFFIEPGGRTSVLQAGRSAGAVALHRKFLEVDLS